MNLRTCILALLLAAALLPAAARGDEADELRQRFKDRYPALLELRQAGKLGEMYNGLAGAVKAEYLDEKVSEKDRKEPRTVKEFLAAENADRIALYKLIAEQTKTTPEAVAKHNAKRNFEKAGDDEYLKPAKDADWVQKKNLKDAT